MRIIVRVWNCSNCDLKNWILPNMLHAPLISFSYIWSLVFWAKWNSSLCSVLQSCIAFFHVSHLFCNMFVNILRLCWQGLRELLDCDAMSNCTVSQNHGTNFHQIFAPAAHRTTVSGVRLRLVWLLHWTLAVQCVPFARIPRTLAWESDATNRPVGYYLFRFWQIVFGVAVTVSLLKASLVSESSHQLSMFLIHQKDVSVIYKIDNNFT